MRVYDQIDVATEKEHFLVQLDGKRQTPKAKSPEWYSFSTGEPEKCSVIYCSAGMALSEGRQADLIGVFSRKKVTHEVNP